MDYTVFQNEYLDYPNSKLWDMETWEDRQSKVWELGLWLTNYVCTYKRKESKLEKYSGRDDGEYVFKVHANMYEDAISEWKKLGMDFTRGEMANICWFALSPEGVKKKTLKNPRVIIVLHDGDYDDPNWMMNELEYYREYSIAAIEAKDVIMLYVASNGPDLYNTFINVNTELASVLHFTPSKVYMDVSPVYRAGKTLKEIPNFKYVDEVGNEITNPDSKVEKLGAFEILDVTGRWANTSSNIMRSLQSGAYDHPLYSMEEFKHSECGHVAGKGPWFEYNFKSGTDKELIEYWEKRGITFKEHFTDGERWIIFMPKSATEHPERKLPLVHIFNEVTEINPFLDLISISYYTEWFPLVADGKCAVSFYAMESADDNDFVATIIEEACNRYPLDPERIYITGHSHNGHFCGEFARRHPDLVAACATLGNEHGIPLPDHTTEVVLLSCDDVAKAAKNDIPWININGYCESRIAWGDMNKDEYTWDVIAWKRRRKALRCPEQNEDVIKAARNSKNYVTRMLGVPTDRTDLQYVCGREVYIGDIKNCDGNYHFRIATIERMVHITSPQMPSLSWNFMSRFARNRRTGEVIERY
ncbi:MAG: hypothetical protein E7273_02565 [Pseudobutyrivibrio ruminis]|nr:hypothetical protein [Pseudobutyrivibrio ruminis]